MDAIDLLAQADEAPFAYPARLTAVSQGAAAPGLAAVIKDISHAGALLAFEPGHRHQLPELLAQGRVRLEFVGPAGRKVELVGRLSGFLRQGAQVLAHVSFENIHLPEVEEVQALRASPRKDQRMLWELWDGLQREGA